MHSRRTAAARTTALVTALVGAAFVATPAGAQVLNFEGIGASPTNPEPPIGNFYNGGAGPNYGIDFSPNALALCLNTPTQSCSNTSRGGRGDPASQNTGLFFLTGASTYMNSMSGFTNGFSFFYAAPNNAGSFNVWSGLNGTGTLLATLALAQTPTGPEPCYGAGFCPFAAAGVSFAGVAQSVTFAGVANQIVFDDVTFGSPIPGVVSTPEPATWALLGAGLSVVAAAARRRRSAPTA